jgi:dipeptidyl aminopeptidase/acylaminoacyl peptidase
MIAAHARTSKASAVNVFLTSGAQTLTATVGQSGDTLTFKLATSDMRILLASDGMPSVILLPGQGARVVRATSAVSASAGRISYDAPSKAPYTAEQVKIPSGRGYDLAATFTKPTGVAKVPVVITISGSGPQERDSRISIVPGYEFFRQIADTLGRRGIAVLRFDDRGVGESGGRESAIKATSADFADDVRSIITWLRARADVDGARIVLAGHSEGGMIAPLVASTDPRVRAIALMAGPAYDGRRIIMFQNRESIDALPGLTRAQRDSIFKTVPAGLDSVAKTTPWMAYFLSHDPLVTARLVKQPVLLLQGATDHQITPEQGDTLRAALTASGNRDVILRKFPATNHLFVNDPSGAPGGYGQLKDARVRKEVLGALADWAVRVLK